MDWERTGYACVEVSDSDSDLGANNCDRVRSDNGISKNGGLVCNKRHCLQTVWFK